MVLVGALCATDKGIFAFHAYLPARNECSLFILTTVEEKISQINFVKSQRGKVSRQHPEHTY